MYYYNFLTTTLNSNKIKYRNLLCKKSIKEIVMITGKLLLLKDG
jgi:hypothetical protein